MNKKAKKTIIWSITAVMLAFLLVVGTFIAVFASKDPKLTPEKLDDADFFFGAKITQNVLYQSLKSKKKNDIKLVRISNTEMQSAVKLAENGEAILYLITGIKPKIQNPENAVYKINYDNGLYRFTVKLTDTFCSLCFVASGIAKLEYEKGELDIDFISLKIGKFELPGKYKEKAKKYILASLKKDDFYKVFCSSVQKVEYSKNGDVRIYYYPYRLRKHITKITFN